MFRHYASRQFIKYFALCLMFPVCACLARAQGGIESTGTGGTARIQGRIYFPSGRRSDAIQVKVTLESTSSDRLSVIANLNGGFTFESLSPGSYYLTVDAGEAYETAREAVVIDKNVNSRTMSPAELARMNIPRTFNVIITLRPKETDNRAGVVDASLASVPKPALDAYQKGVELAQSGDVQKAIEQLKLAVSLYSEFALAHNELGVQYLKIGAIDRAVESFTRALQIKPDAIATRLNYGIALVEKGNFEEAETQLRQVIGRNDGLATAHLYLGIALIKLHRYDVAETELRRALDLGHSSVSLAHYYLGGLFWKKKQYKIAADELESYLKSTPKTPDAERLRATIRDLRSKEATTPLENPDPNRVKSVRSPD